MTESNLLPSVVNAATNVLLDNAPAFNRNSSYARAYWTNPKLSYEYSPQNRPNMLKKQLAEEAARKKAEDNFKQTNLYKTIHSPGFVDKWEQDTGYEQKKAEHKEALAKWNDERENRNRMANKGMLSFWENEGNRNAYDEESADLDNFNKLNGEFERRFTDMSGNMVKPTSASFLGFTSQQITPKPVLDVYNDIYGYRDRRGIKYGGEIANQLSYDSPVDRNLIDDGSSVDSRDSIWINGPEYRRQREAGIPGRPVDEISMSPYEIYSKQEEQEDYGYVPYIPDQQAVQKFHDESTYPKISNAFRDLADIRRLMSDYTIKWNGMDISGKDLARKLKIYGTNHPEYEDEDFVSNLVSEKRENEWAIPLGLDSDGQVIELPSDDGAVAFLNYDPVELEDGTKLNIKDANKLHAYANMKPKEQKEEQQKPDFDDIEVDYGFADMGRPVVENPFTEGGWLPWLTDLLFGSLPYFYPAAGFTKAQGDFGMNVNGMDLRDDYLNNTFSLLNEDPTVSDIMASSLASLTMPMTEMIWGPAGTVALGASPARKLMQLPNFFSKKAQQKAWRAATGSTAKIPEDAVRKIVSDEFASKPASRLVQGAIDEGFEEVPGNITEGFQSSGLRNWYADDTGKRDTQNDPIYKDTNGWKRTLNFLLDAPLAMLGGAALGGPMGFTQLNRYRQDYADQVLNDAIGKIDLDKYMQDEETMKDVALAKAAIASQSGFTGVPDDIVSDIVELLFGTMPSHSSGELTGLIKPEGYVEPSPMESEYPESLDEFIETLNR